MLGIGLGLYAGRRTAWWPAGASYAADFINDRYMRSANAIPAGEALGFSRASTKWAQNSSGTWLQFAANKPARTDLGLSLEPAGTNVVPNPGLAGAAVGVVGAGGSLPTGWYANSVLNTEVLALTTLAGLPAIRLRISGIASGTFYELNMMPAATAMAASTAYAASVVVQTHDATVPVIELRQASDTDAFVAANALLPNAGQSISRIGRTFTSLAGTVRGRARLSYTPTLGAAFLAEVTLACPQVELGSTVTSPLFEARSGDALTLNLPAGTFSLGATWSDGSTSSYADAEGNYAFTTSPPRPIVQRIWAIGT